MAIRYVSPTGNNGNSGTEASPLQSIATAAGQAGNGGEVLLQAGQVHAADHYIGNTGITFTAYGSGAFPEVSGFVTASGWVHEGGDVYSFTDSGLQTTLNCVSINGIFRPLARYPNNGYRTFTAHTGTSYGTITDASLSNLISFVGGEVVIRANHWILKRGLITGQSNGVITYGALTGQAASYEPLDNYGYFIQNHASCLDDKFDWWYSGSAKKLYMYFPGDNPSNYVIKLSKAVRAFNLGDATGSIFENIHITGINQWGILGGPSCTFRDMEFSFCGQHGIYMTGTSGVTVDNVKFKNMPNNGITGDTGCNNWTVKDSDFDLIHHWPGMGGSADTQGFPIVVLGDNSFIKYNKIRNAGYNPIYVRGNGFIVDNNDIRNFGYVKDDGGGIYTFEGISVVNSTRRKIRNNIIMNGIGAPEGTADGDSKAYGIYPDEKASELDVENNAVKNCNKAMFLHNARNVAITGNKLFKNKDGIYIRTFDAGEPSNNISVDGNVIVAAAGQKLIVHDSASTEDFGSASNNGYYSPDASPFVTRQNEGSFTSRTFAAWKTATGNDGTGSVLTNNLNTFMINNPSKVGIFGSFNGVVGTIVLDDHESEIIIPG